MPKHNKFLFKDRIMLISVILC